MAGEVAFAAVAVSASGASDSGRAACSGLAVLLAGRARGSGMGSDGHAASTCAITSARPAVAAIKGRNEFTLPPEQRALCDESYWRGQVE